MFRVVASCAPRIVLGKIYQTIFGTSVGSHMVSKRLSSPAMSTSDLTYQVAPKQLGQTSSRVLSFSRVVASPL